MNTKLQFMAAAVARQVAEASRVDFALPSLADGVKWGLGDFDPHNPTVRTPQPPKIPNFRGVH